MELHTQNKILKNEKGEGRLEGFSLACCHPNFKAIE
jgi:hypothetical protein